MEWPLSPAAIQTPGTPRAMKSGHLIFHNPSAQVHHSHNQSHWYRLKQYFATRIFLKLLLRVQPNKFLWSEVETFSALLEFRLQVAKLRERLRKTSTPMSRIRVQRSLTYFPLRALEKWGPKELELFAQQLLHQFPVEPLNRYFNIVCWKVLRYYRKLRPKVCLSLIDNVEAQVVGDSLAQSYYRCDRLKCISKEFAHLGELLQ